MIRKESQDYQENLIKDDKILRLRDYGTLLQNSIKNSNFWIGPACYRHEFTAAEDLRIKPSSSSSPAKF